MRTSARRELAIVSDTIENECANLVADENRTYIGAFCLTTLAIKPFLIIPLVDHKHLFYVF